MKNELVTSACLSTINSKNKLSKQEEQTQNHGYRECFHGCQMGGRYGENG